MNIYGFFSVYNKEVKRFLKVYNQTLIAPIVNSLLFLAIFTLAIGQKIQFDNNISFSSFMVPGLITMVIIQNSFANSSSSITMAKVLGHIIDFLIPPLSATSLTFAICLAAATRGIIVGLLSYFVFKLFVPMTIINPLTTIIYLLLTSLSLGALGLLCGLYANNFDQMSAITSYIITPLSFLSGTFYSITSLPTIWQKVSLVNPFFYMIDGIRYSLTGYHDGNLTIGIIYLTLFNIILFSISIYWIKSGYRVKN
jgi:ABC-2 type transport system permease protein